VTAGSGVGGGDDIGLDRGSGFDVVAGDSDSMTVFSDTADLETGLGGVVTGSRGVATGAIVEERPRTAADVVVSVEDEDGEDGVVLVVVI